MKRNRKGQFVKKGAARKNPKRRRTARRRRATAAPRVNPRRRRRRARRAHVARNPSPRRRRRRRAHVARNPSPRRRARRRGFRRNPVSSPVTAWLLAGAVGVAATLAMGVGLPKVFPAEFQQGYGYPITLVAIGTIAGVALQKYKHPILAVGIGMPFLTIGGFLLWNKAREAYEKSQVATNPRSFRAAYQRGQMPGPTMGAVAAYTPRQLGMGAVVSYGTMGAVESMVGDGSVRPNFYTRTGTQLGAY